MNDEMTEAGVPAGEQSGTLSENESRPAGTEADFGKIDES